jgi:hypothetical protein
MATTSGDGLRYPSNYALPADVPADLANLANDVQTALNKRAAIIPAVIAIPSASGWKQSSDGQDAMYLEKTGRVVVARGAKMRSSAKTFTRDEASTLGTVPSGYRPVVTMFAVGSWLATVGGELVHQPLVIRISTGGDVDMYAPNAGSMAVDDYLSIAGITWTTA